MRATGFRLDMKGFKKKTDAIGKITAGDFRAELMEFVRKTLTTAARNTPARDYSIIRTNQLRQYDARVNFIPSSHELVDPSLRINGRTHWLYYRGKWLNAKDWRISDDAFAAYSRLLIEHERRKQTAQATFIRERAQARFLYRRSWTEAADDLGVALNVAQSTRAARTRKRPAVNPPKASATLRGNSAHLRVQITNPFLQETGKKYRQFFGSDIIAAAMTQHRGAYESALKRRMTKIRKTI